MYVFTRLKMCVVGMESSNQSRCSHRSWTSQHEQVSHCHLCHVFLFVYLIMIYSYIQFRSVLWPSGLSGGHEGRFSRDPVPFFSAGGLVSSSGMGRHVHSLTLSIQHFLCWPRHCSAFKVPWWMVLERLLWQVTCQNHASFYLLTAARGGSNGPTFKMILLQSLVLCSK